MSKECIGTKIIYRIFVNPNLTLKLQVCSYRYKYICSYELKTNNCTSKHHSFQLIKDFCLVQPIVLNPQSTR